MTHFSALTSNDLSRQYAAILFSIFEINTSCAAEGSIALPFKSHCCRASKKNVISQIQSAWMTESTTTCHWLELHYLIRTKLDVMTGCVTCQLYFWNVFFFGGGGNLKSSSKWNRLLSIFLQIHANEWNKINIKIRPMSGSSNIKSVMYWFIKWCNESKWEQYAKFIN